tara:strand:+ start:127 stop:1014 length:888 start_codon:yes stop_codon:yes gene_type:complete
MNYDLFGNPVIEKTNLREKFLVPPFSIIDTQNGDWQEKKERWKRLGIKSEIGRDANLLGYSKTILKTMSDNGTSIFDPVLAELMYRWFCKDNGKILDPFAGGSVRGIVSNYLGYKYTGIDLRESQVGENYKQAFKILPNDYPKWISGDSEEKLNDVEYGFDFIFSCPPYYDLEKYSEDKDDLSNLSFELFNIKYTNIIKKAVSKLKDNSLAAFVIGNSRYKKGSGLIKNLYTETIKAFENSGMGFYNDIILKNSTGNAAMRAGRTFKATRKITKTHQYVLVFLKGDASKLDVSHE